MQIQSWIHEAAYINGEWVTSESGEQVAVTNPADGATLGHVPALSAQQVASAIEAANVALPAWKSKTAAQRAAVLSRWHALIMENEAVLGELMTLEQGKPLREARGEIGYAASFIEWFAEEAKRIYGDTIPGHAADKRIIVTREPVGVCAAITPWNFPAAMITRKVAPALAAGCTIVVKPAMETPLTALALAALAEQAGVPAGVINIVTGDAQTIGQVLTESPVVRKLSFTGSTAVGAKLMAACAPTVKKVSLELGGNAPFIVFDDADIDEAVAGAIDSKFRNAGQTCVCANRIYVQSGVYDTFVERLAQRTQALKVGAGSEEGVDIGPLISEKAVAKVEEHLQDALAKGGRVLAGGQRHALGGTWYAPTVVAEATADMACAREETFGPLAPVFRFEDEAEVIRLANDTEFGLAAYFYAESVSRIWRVSEALEYGMVGINTGLISTAAAPFGGVKSSGIGREGSRYGIDEYTEMKYLCLGIKQAE
ncbi:MAG: NAD-dependent succinate-semialdehyde dehydrogenase [Halomonas sp.]|uniref:NAD-dependent succinate-semialdehyde dehydrogenase n=1 Tax=unclassified Halomonas TaxID=2609666 RepID=UPI0009C0E550|nr:MULTISPECIES: NAD-dependent succinate-semialdehyde dehydrogenase [unclassified Halomonas]MDM7480780.1 NAD-dependent succinate-semialdehyde dehydrogenase [Halomonas sp.]NGO90240.1 succinate-semialdehyde dehydrogenase [Halomonas sp.]